MKESNATAVEFADFQPVASLPGVEILHARFVGHRFDPHAHDEWAIGAVISGAKDNAIGRDSNILQAGDIGAMYPGQAHGGKVHGTAPCHYAWCMSATLCSAGVRQHWESTIRR